MCNGASEWISSHTIRFHIQRQQSKRCRVRVHRLSRRKRHEENGGKDMELKNLKLYMENISISEENEKLRKKATLLHQENLALMCELQKKFSGFDRLSDTIS
ncbi:unnamed protein product [Ilex paraguariensis]|uniref:Uncharacterized protein n=1 Tax=Ilex paraguariensis TaxID=185542 RepID=A0ABC8U249_9AQUA